MAKIVIGPDGAWVDGCRPDSFWSCECDICVATRLEDLAASAPTDGRNPKTLMGLRKIPNLSVIPPAAILHMGLAMRYGAYESPRADGGTGYGPYNWRDQPVEASVYVDACLRHVMQFWDGEDQDPKTLASHLGHALATIGILVDAIESGTCLDDRPKIKSGVASKILDRETKRG